MLLQAILLCDVVEAKYWSLSDCKSSCLYCSEQHGQLLRDLRFQLCIVQSYRQHIFQTGFSPFASIIMKRKRERANTYVVDQPTPVRSR